VDFLIPYFKCKMKSFFVVVAVIACFLAASVAAKSAKLERVQWDIAEGIFGSSVLAGLNSWWEGTGLQGKSKGHEDILKSAYNDLTAPQRAAFYQDPASVLFTTGFVRGVQYPDMPIGSSTADEASNTGNYGDDLTAPDTRNAQPFLSQFNAGKAGSRDTLVAKSHFGCLQTWHAQAPVPVKFDDTGAFVVYNNQDVQDIIKAQFTRIWAAAVAAKTANNKALADFHIARIIHTVGDSYAPAHTYRTINGNACSAIKVFQEYGSQAASEAHGVSDHTPTGGDALKLFNCAKASAKVVLEAWSNCVLNSVCTIPSSVTDIVNIDQATKDNIAAGSLEAYADTEAKKNCKTDLAGTGGASVCFKKLAKGRTLARGAVNNNPCAGTTVSGGSTAFATPIITP
jgi:hypothetical protein